MPDEALRFAKGEKVVSSTGVPARLIRPLDFLVVADHAENLGLAPLIEESDPQLLRDPMGKRYHDLVSQNLRPDGDGGLNVYHWESTASGLAGV